MTAFIRLLEQKLKKNVKRDKEEQLIAKTSILKKSLTPSLPPVKSVFASELLPPDYSQRHRKCSSRHLYNRLKESDTFHANANLSTQVCRCKGTKFTNKLFGNNSASKI